MFRIVLLALLALSVAGCKPAPEPAPAPAPETLSTPVEPAPPGQTESTTLNQADQPSASTEEITLDILNWEQTQALVKKHPGKVVVMDIWATYCPPCIAEFPNLVRLSREHPDKVACISVSLDYDGLDDEPAESARPKVMKFLMKQGATFQNVLLSITPEKLFSEKIDQQSIPIVYVFDQQGKLQGTFPDPKNPAEFTYQKDILPLVKKLLADE